MPTIAERNLVAVACLLSGLGAGCREAGRPSARDAKEPSGPDSASGVPMDASAFVGGVPGAWEGPRALCRRDRDCPASERCCSSGLVGVCASLEASRECPAPDLTLAFPADFSPRFEYALFDESDCLLQKCVGGQGPRRLLRFPLDVVNRGAGPIILALSDAPGVRRVACDGSLFLDDFLRYEIIDAELARRASGVGDVAFSCQPGAMAESSSPFDCDVIGLEAHSYRSYSSDADCQWVDVTTLPPGQYTLRVSVNADWRLTEQDFGNNVLERTVVIPEADPLAPCQEEVPEELGFGENIECGWEMMPRQTGVACAPGELVSLECTFCAGAYLPRVCPGFEACSAAGAVRYSTLREIPQPCADEHRCDGSGQCTTFPFVCPASGRYTLLGFPKVPVLPIGFAPASAPEAVSCRAVGESAFAVGSMGYRDEPIYIGEIVERPRDAGAAAP
jgi:hypothetical protein